MLKTVVKQSKSSKRIVIKKLRTQSETFGRHHFIEVVASAVLFESCQHLAVLASSSEKGKFFCFSVQTKHTSGRDLSSVWVVWSFDQLMVTRLVWAKMTEFDFEYK